MPKPWWTQTTLRRHDAGWSPPTDPAKILPERRTPAPVNALGYGEAQTYAQLISVERRRYDAQRALFLAGCELARVYHQAAEYGIPVPRDAVRAWTTARQRWIGIINSRNGRTAP